MVVIVLSIFAPSELIVPDKDVNVSSILSTEEDNSLQYFS
nr:MAG TPA: hypothetical protein [Herelleviridae sp.]